MTLKTHTNNDDDLVLNWIISMSGDHALMSYTLEKKPCTAVGQFFTEK